jgi:multidrug resistance efflux pump
MADNNLNAQLLSEPSGAMGVKESPVKPPTGNMPVRSEEAQEIIGNESGFLEKWALFLVLGILALLISATFFINYPDVVQVQATLTSLNGPKDIVPFESGRITQLFIQNGGKVQKGDVLAFVESSADPHQVIALSKKVTEAITLLTAGEMEKVSNVFSEPYNSLGEVQASYQTFISAIQQFNDYYVTGYYQHKKDALERDLATITEMNQTLKDELSLTQKDYALSQKSYEMNKRLYDEKVISEQELRDDQSKLFNKQLSIPQINSNILSNQNQQRDKIKELEELDHDLSKQRTTVEQALETLQSVVSSWIHKYVIASPVDGTLYMTRPLQTGQYIQEGKNIAYVASNDNRIFAEVYLPQNSIGKVSPGMQVQLRFEAYPYQQYGVVNGKMEDISNVVSDSGYLATISLYNGLLTSQQRKLQFKDGLKADALIITKNMSLFKRISYSLIKVGSAGN